MGRIFAKPSRPDEIACTVRDRLVRRVYSSHPGVVALAGLSSAVFGSITFNRTNDLILLGLTSAAILSVGLVCYFLVRHRHCLAESTRAAEIRFGCAAVVASFAIGLMSARTVVSSNDPVAHLLTISLVLSAVAAALRNYFRPQIAKAQLAALIVPGAVAMLLRADPVYLWLAAGSIVLGITMSRIVTSLYSEALAALLKDDELQLQNTRFASALGNMAQGLAMFEKDGTLAVCNEKYRSIYGFSVDVVKPGVPLVELLRHSLAVGNHVDRSPNELLAEFAGQFAIGTSRTFKNKLADGRTIVVSHEAMPNGGWVTTHEDATMAEAAANKIQYLASHDALTGLPNRTTFQANLSDALAGVSLGDEVAVLCLDLDRFKQVNDTLGHPAGDQLLVQVGERLRRCVRPSDTVARLGGDEFAIVQLGGSQPLASSVLAKRIIEVINEPFVVDGHTCRVGCSIGLSTAPADGLDANKLIRNADLALYRAKAEGRNSFRYFSSEIDRIIWERCVLEAELRAAVENQEFVIAYQPLVDLRTSKISAFEALVRWQHPTKGLVPPDEFIPLAEDLGLIVPIGEFVLKEACRSAVTWPHHIGLAVNLSPVQFRTRNLLKTVDQALQESGLAPTRLELEITEGVLLADDGSIVDQLHELRSTGIKIAMDDFGTGYSSLSYVRSFPFDRIKIDRSFIRDIETSADAAAIVELIVRLGSTLGILTTAEGVETAAQLSRLRAEGCTDVQGYYLSRPLWADELANLLTTELHEAAA